MAKEKNQKKNHKKGIVAQIQSGIGISVTLVLVVIALMCTMIVRNMVMDANNTELQLESESAALQLEKYFAPFERMTEQQAVNTEVKSVMNTTCKGQNITSNIKYSTVLNNMKDTQELDANNILAVWIADIDANVLTQSDEYTSGEDFDITSRPWYECTNKKSTILTEPYVDLSTGMKVVSVASPVQDVMGNAIGVSGIDVSLETIMDLMETYKIGKQGYVMLVSSLGTFVYHPDETLMETKIQDLSITSNVITAIENKTSELLKYTVEGEAKYGYITPIGETGFVAISCIPSSQYYSSLITSGAMLLFVFVIGFLFIMLTMYKAAVKIVKPLGELNETALQLAEGNLDVAINVQSEDEVGELGRSIEKTVTRLKEYINYIDEISEVLVNMANGKLAVQLKYAYVGEFQKVKEALLHISDSMNEVMTNISETANQVSVGSDDLAKAAQGLAEGAESQAAAIEELVATSVTVAEQVEENKNDSEKSAIHTQEVTVMMEESRNQMEQMREAMNNIQEASKKVVGIITAIEEIAEQTNLLSLNASIEAARAGEAGRGFAVVAGEIGNLANESARAVNTTRELIEVSLNEIEKGNILAEEVMSSISKVVSKVEEVNEMIQRTAESAETQMQSVNQIRSGVEEMSQSIQDNSAMAEETSATSEELAAQAVNLNELVQMFELK